MWSSCPRPPLSSIYRGTHTLCCSVPTSAPRPVLLPLLAPLYWPGFLIGTCHFQAVIAPCGYRPVWCWLCGLCWCGGLRLPAFSAIAACNVFWLGDDVHVAVARVRAVGCVLVDILLSDVFELPSSIISRKATAEAGFVLLREYDCLGHD